MICLFSYWHLKNGCKHRNTRHYCWKAANTLKVQLSVTSHQLNSLTEPPSFSKTGIICTKPACILREMNGGVICSFGDISDTTHKYRPSYLTTACKNISWTLGFALVQELELIWSVSGGFSLSSAVCLCYKSHWGKLCFYVIIAGQNINTLRSRASRVRATKQTRV